VHIEGVGESFAKKAMAKAVKEQKNNLLHLRGGGGGGRKRGFEGGVGVDTPQLIYFLVCLH
jgi:hypothetical protein